MSDINDITDRVIGTAIQVHKVLAPGYSSPVPGLPRGGDGEQGDPDPIFTAQVLSYLKLGGYQAGLLINFKVKYLGKGAIRRLVNGYRGPLPRVPRVPR